MSLKDRPVFYVALFVVLALPFTGCSGMASTPDTLRIAVFNIRVLSTDKIVNVDSSGAGVDSQLVAAAEIIRAIRPDVLVLNELWHDYTTYDPPRVDLAENARRFVAAYVNQGSDALDFPHAYASACNTGMLSGFDLNADDTVATERHRGTRTYADDCWGWGPEPGAFSMGLLSRYPIDTAAARTFGNFRWIDLPGHHMPVAYYPEAAVPLFPLSSKSHWDVPVQVGGRTLHLLMSVPTPSIFDGLEDRNGRRNFDEIKFWKHYIEGDSALYDDSGRHGGFGGAHFVIAGDLNAYMSQETDYDGIVAIQQLLEHPLVRDTGEWLTSEGALMGDAPGPPDHPERRTILAGTFTERLDYILPSRSLEVVDGGVYWPAAADSAGSALAARASDHRLVWLDVRVPPRD